MTFINSMEVREDDEEFKNSVDLLFDELEEKDPNHFAVRQYRKFIAIIKKTNNRQSWQTNGGNREEKRK